MLMHEIANGAHRADVEEMATRPGKVFLVGAGPGAVDLITVKGLRCLRAADVVVYDRLVEPALLEEARADATLIYAGKGPRCHTLDQTTINALLVTHARQGKTVTRLKGGDPFIFGRGGEEALALAAAGIPFEIVPGVTSAIAVPAYAGIPVTQRGQSSAVTIVTGHEGTSINWEALAQLGGTIVIMMGVAALPAITAQLLAAGLAPTTPAAVIQQGTTAAQRVISGDVAAIATLAADAGLTSPAVTVVGAVASLHETLAWFDIAADVAGRDELAVKTAPEGPDGHQTHLRGSHANAKMSSFSANVTGEACLAPTKLTRADGCGAGDCGFNR